MLDPCELVDILCGLVGDNCLPSPLCDSIPGVRVRGLTGVCRRRGEPFKADVEREGLLREARRSEG